MALIIVSLLVLVPLALLGWDLAHRRQPESDTVEAGPARAPHARVAHLQHHS
jgi:hypothetical protein